MKKDNQLEDKIDRYISDSMSESEREEFKLLLQNDNDLSERVENEKLIKLNIKRYHRTQVKKQLQNIHETTMSKKIKKKWLSIGVFLAFVSTLCVVYLTSQKKPNTDKLYAEYYSKYKFDVDQRGTNETSLIEIIKLYNDNSFEEVIENTQEYIFKNIPASDRLIIGISFLETNQPEDAKAMFQSIIDEDNFVFKDKAIWYKAMAELKSKNIPETISLLNKIVKNKDSDNYEEAKRLLDTLDHN